MTDAKCTNSNGIEMKNVLQNAEDLGYKYMHLVPTGTMEPMDTDFEDDEDDNDENYDNYFGMSGSIDFGGMINNLWNKARNAYTDFVNILDYDSNNYDYYDDETDIDFEDDTNDSTHFEWGLDDIFGSFTNLWSDTDDTDTEYYDYNGRYNYDMDKLNGLEINEESEDEQDEIDRDIEMYEDTDTEQLEIDEEIESDIDTDSEYVYNENNDEFIVAKDNVFASGIGGENEKVLANDEDAASIASEEKHDLVIVEMTVIIVFVMVCGVMYAGYKFLLERRAKQREFDYYLGASSPL